MSFNPVWTFPLLVAQTVKRLSTVRETRVRARGWEDPWRRKWQSTPVLLPGKSHGQRSLVGYSPWGRKESDTTEQLHFTHFNHVHFFLLFEVQLIYNIELVSGIQQCDSVEHIYVCMGFHAGAVVKNPPANAGDMGSIPGLGRFHMLQSN